MPNALVSQITIPVEVSGQVINVTYDIKDAYARQRIEQLGNAIYWMGVTTTELTNGSTTNPITIEGESETADVGGMAQYDGEEFILEATDLLAVCICHENDHLNGILFTDKAVNGEIYYAQEED